MRSFRRLSAGRKETRGGSFFHDSCIGKRGNGASMNPWDLRFSEVTLACLQACCSDAHPRPEATPTSILSNPVPSAFDPPKSSWNPCSWSPGSDHSDCLMVSVNQNCLLVSPESPLAGITSAWHRIAGLEQGFARLDGTWSCCSGPAAVLLLMRGNPHQSPFIRINPSCRTGNPNVRFC